MRRIATTVAVLLVSALAAPAQAAITTSTITSPADNFTQLITGVGPTFTPATLTLSGTSNGTTGDMIQVRAYYGTAPLARPNCPDSAVAANGTWSTSIPNDQNCSPWYGGATLYAVPLGAPATLPNSANFQPVRVTPDRQATMVSSGMPRTSGSSTPARRALRRLRDRSCSVCDTAIYDATDSRGNYVWYGAGIYSEEAGYGAVRGYLRVDGRNAVSLQASKMEPPRRQRRARAPRSRSRTGRTASPTSSRPCAARTRHRSRPPTTANAAR